MYYDDFEINDPLGGHTGSQTISAFYYSFPTLRKNVSCLENIFVALLMKSKYLKTFDPKKCLDSRIEKLKDLEEKGISFNIGTSVIQVYFVLGLVIGDNLGLNSLLRFSHSFSHNFFFRLCKMNKGESKTNTLCEDNYELDLLDDYKNTGIKENCIFNVIKSSHVTENDSVDLMHDAFEGIINYGLLNSLRYFIIDKKYFTL